MSQPWSGSSNSPVSASASSYGHQQQQYSMDRSHAYGLPPLNGHGHASTMALNDDYDDAEGDDLGDLPGSSLGLGVSSYSPGSGPASSAKNEKAIRRRSSKACDQCRKSKCKCERSGPHEPCRNCVMLGTACTFLGPSRKRGPPKGYIDAIEARLHQTEALIGILLGSKDSRARTVLEDLSTEDPLAKEIIDRVDNSPYGHKGRSRGAEATGSSRSRPAPSEGRDGDSTVQSTHPSNEWQDKVIARLNTVASTRNTLLTAEDAAELASSGDLRYPEDDTVADARARPLLALSQPGSGGNTAGPSTATSDQSSAEQAVRRQRRRVGDEPARSPSTASLSGRSRSPGGARDDEDYEEAMDGEEASGEDELAIEIGQLSLNEDEQVRFHGKASGLHLLGMGIKEGLDGRNEGGIWRFPKARVWPPLPPNTRTRSKVLEDFSPRLPDAATQELLLELYFTYVHPALPIVHKRAFMEDFRNGNTMSADSPYSDQASDAASPISASSLCNPRRRRTPTLLLLAMFSIAARYSARTGAEVPPPQEGSMWTAGDSYLEDAKVILDASYAASRPSTCQALLLMGYREIAIGAMAQAWLYVGMAVRMAQDLGLHKSADRWTSTGRNLFTTMQLQERRRIWYGCVIMDKYVSAYIGRPVAICERDFDTELPSTAETDELELWSPHPSPPLDDGADDPAVADFAPSPGHIISCFTESAKLSVILSVIMQEIYAIRPRCDRQTEFSKYEKLLTKWYLELPEPLRFEPASAKPSTPPPHILTLHMQYWCTVLLLRRPFIRHLSDSRSTSTSSKDCEIRASSRKNYDLCVQAANHITSIVSVYAERFNPKRASAFMCYYVFTAAIMHVAALTTYPSDPQARVGLDKCMDVLKRMQILWPSAFRALELLHGAKPSSPEPEISRSRLSDRPKRAAEQSLDHEDTNDGARLLTSDQLYRQQQSYHNVAPSSPPASQQGFIGLNLPPGDSSAYMPQYDRWAGETTLPSFAGSLTTSVLPQQYSTGLVGERLPPSITRSTERQGQRYPQYWSDYSALGQMDTTYGVPVIGEMVPQHANAPQPDQPSMYVPDPQYMFSGYPQPALRFRHG
ncbi:fungal-specific transcription factor domain-containing protein [Sparassis latifolia]